MIYEFYIIPAIPLLALSISISAYSLLSTIKRSPVFCFLYYPTIMAIFLGFVFIYSSKNEVYKVDQTSNQIQSVDWIKNNIASDSIILIDNFAFLDLRNKIPRSININRNAEWYWKADKDPEIRLNLLRNDWGNIDYLLASGQMKADAVESDLELVKLAFENSKTVIAFVGQDPETRNDIEIRKGIISINRGKK